MKKTLILLSAIALLFTSCSKELELQPDVKKTSVSKLQNTAITNGITKFVFTKVDNPGLSEDVEGVIAEDNQINVIIYADGISLTNLKPTITYNGEAMLSPLSGVARNFTRGVFYTYYNTEFGTSISYLVKVTVKPAAQRPKKLYTTGYLKNGNDVQPCYWVNGKIVKLSASSTIAYTKGIVVKGDDVYVAGTVHNGSFVKAVYWKNGQEYTLSDNYSWISDITVSGNDIYIVGMDDKKLVYWKNGVKVIFDDYNVNRANGKKIIVESDDVYILGTTEIINDKWFGCYWKNGVKHILPVESNLEPTAYEMGFSNSNFYIFGSLHSSTVPMKFACWKNGILTELPLSYYDGYTKIFKDGFYRIGNYYTSNGHKAAYWKNGIRQELETLDFSYSIVDDIFVSENDVYAIGQSNYLLPNTKFYWVNGKLNVFTTETEAVIYGMFVK